jgi:hypothetical protein
MKSPKPTVAWILTSILLTACSLLAGCDEDKRLAEMANKNAQRQAAQNEEMARLNREIAEGSKRLVAGNAESNSKLLTAQQKLDDQRVQIDAQRQLLADERHRESILGPLITTVGTLLVCGLPLVPASRVAKKRRRGGHQPTFGGGNCFRTAHIPSAAAANCRQ